MILKDLKPKEFTILIVDDAEPNLVLLSFVLKQEGFTVITANDGNEALNKVSSYEPDLILLDILMPGIDGYQVSRKLQKTAFASIPVIFLSALSETESKIDAFEAGGVDFINKPFQKEEVLARIKTHLSIRKLEKQKEARIRLLKDREIELSKLSKKKDELIRMVSHDIKNPLTGIIGMTKILLDDDEIEAEERKEILGLIDQSAEKLFNLVKEILDKESNSAELEQIDIKDVDIIDLCTRLIKQLKQKAAAKNINLSIVTQVDELIAPVDKDKIFTALEILIINAIRFTLSGGSVKLHIENTHETNYLIKVVDTGIGISGKILDNFIIPTKKNVEEQRAFDAGLDLGLDIVQKNIRSHKGNIWVSSEEEVGTTFYIDLPFKNHSK